MHHPHSGIQNSREISMPRISFFVAHTHPYLLYLLKMYHHATFCYQPLTIEPLPIQNSITIIHIIRDKLNSIDSVGIPFDCWHSFIEPTKSKENNRKKK